MSNLQYGTDKFIFDYKVTLPSAKEFSGRLKIENKEDFEVLAQYFGDTEWINAQGYVGIKKTLHLFRSKSNR